MLIDGTKCELLLVLLLFTFCVHLVFSRQSKSAKRLENRNTRDQDQSIDYIDLMAKQKWKDILVWVVFKPENILNKDKTGQNLLHYACLYRAPDEVIETILWQAPELANLPNRNSEVPLHWAIRLSASIKTIESLLEASPHSGTRSSDKDGKSPLSLLWDRHREAILDLWVIDHHKIADLHGWKRILMFFECHNRKQGKTKSNTKTIHTACRCPCPPSLFSLITRVYSKDILSRDEFGRTPLHMACMDAVANGSSDMKSKIQMLLSLGAVQRSNCCEWKDNFGRLPIHYALSAGVTWEEGLQQLIGNAPCTLSKPDPSTNLEPFMLLACAFNANRENANGSPSSLKSPLVKPAKALSTIYQLLRMDPSRIP